MIFFDIDGTLIDHKKAEFIGVNCFYEEYSNLFELGVNDFYNYWCIISDKHFMQFLKGEISFDQQRINRIKDVFSLSGIELSDYEANEKFMVYLHHYEESLLPYDDVLPCLNKLKNIRLGIISNGDLKQQTLKLSKIGFGGVFEVIVAASDVGVSKPDTGIFKIACEKAKSNVRDCYYIGDDLQIDILPCIKAGMKGIWINRNNVQQTYDGIKMIRTLEELIK
jgi:putative hydrolase of the HAD superfamily